MTAACTAEAEALLDDLRRVVVRAQVVAVLVTNGADVGRGGAAGPPAVTPSAAATVSDLAETGVDRARRGA